MKSKWVRRLGQAALIATAALLVVLARKIAWGEVLHALAALPGRTLGLAAAVAVAAHLTYTGFDVLGKAYTRHRLPLSEVMPITFVCYVFNLNLGAWLGTWGLRFRLYARRGLAPFVIGQLVTFSILTNWIAYCALGGALFASGLLAPMAPHLIRPGLLRGLGVVLLLVAASYLALCWFSPRRAFVIRGRQLALPEGPLAVLQLLLGSLNWCLMALVLTVLLQGRVSYPIVLGTLMISAVAGVVSHIPAGLGVLEAIFVAMLGQQMPQPTLLAAVLGYRALYFLGPLIVATLTLLLLETRRVTPGSAARRSTG